MVRVLNVYAIRVSSSTRYLYENPFRSVPSIGSDRLVFAGQLFRHGGEGRAAWKRASNGTSNASTSAKTLVHLRRSFVRRPRLNNAAAGKWILMAASTARPARKSISMRGDGRTCYYYYYRIFRRVFKSYPREFLETIWRKREKGYIVIFIFFHDIWVITSASMMLGR